MGAGGGGGGGGTPPPPPPQKKIEPVFYQRVHDALVYLIGFYLKPLVGIILQLFHEIFLGDISAVGVAKMGGEVGRSS